MESMALNKKQLIMKTTNAKMSPVQRGFQAAFQLSLRPPPPVFLSSCA